MTSRMARYFLLTNFFACLLFGVGELCAQNRAFFYPGHPAAPVHGYFQPVKIRGPEETAIALPSPTGGHFDEKSTDADCFGLLVGQDYRLRITGIPYHPGLELFPTVKVIARTWPPQGLERQYPIQIDITQEDLELALSGRFVTRAIYLENPRTAMPLRGDLGQLSVDVENGSDPVALATSYGQPVAILRLGGRIPKSLGGVDPSFFYTLPPWIAFEKLQNSDEPTQRDSRKEQATHHEANQNGVLTIDPALSEQGAAILARHHGGEQNFRGSWRPHAHSGHWPQTEYLVDGGADGNVYVEDDWTVRNMQGEDTVAHFDTLNQQVLVEPSNRVHLYAPRFGAVRKIEGLVHSGQVTVLSEANNQWALSEQHRKESLGFTAAEMQAGYARSRDQLGGVDGKKRSTGVGNKEALGAFGNFDSAMLYSNQLRQNSIGSAELVYLAEGSAGARAWQGAEGVKIGTNVLAPVAATSEQGAESFFQIDVDDSKTSKLRLIKVASKNDAQPGDIIEFTLRFDNVGDRVIGNVTILDNLTTRLEFLPGTAKSSLASGFAVQPNDSGSFTLRFEITDPLEQGQFGVVQFQCRVR